MGNLYSTGYTETITTVPAINQEPNMGGGRVRIYYDTYLQGAADAALGDVVVMKPLPRGARLVPGGLLAFGTGTTSETLAVGVTGAAANLLAATAAATAGVASLAVPFTIAAGGTYETPATSDVNILVTSAGAVIKAAQRITVHIPYVID